MYPTTSTYRAALAGSVAHEITASAWLDGRMTAQLELAPGGTMVRDIGQYGTTGTLTLPVHDPTGALSALSPTAPLAPFGQRLMLHSTLHAGAWSETIPLGVWRITDPGWEGSTWGRVVGSTWIPSPQLCTVSAVDLLDEVATDEIPTPLSPLYGGTVSSETVRLLDGILPIGAWDDRTSVSSGPVWEGNRLQALSQVAQLAECIPDVDRTGAYAPRSTAPKPGPADWEITGDILVSQAPVPPSDDVVNAWIIEGTDLAGAPIRGVAQIDVGPLRYGGPFGRRTRRETNPLMRTAHAITQAARTRLDRHLDRVTLPIELSCALNPALDLLDRVRVDMQRGPLTGQVTRIELPLSGESMRITLAVPWQEVWR